MLRGAWGRRGSHPRASALQGRTATGLASRAKDCRRSGFRFPAGSEIDPATETRFGQPNPPAGPAARWPESDGGRPGPPGQLLSGEARFARKVFTRQEPNRPYRVPGSRNRRIERRLWADRPKGPSPVVSAGRPPASPGGGGMTGATGSPGRRACQLAAGLGFGGRKFCSRGSRASLWVARAAPSDRVFVPPLPLFWFCSLTPLAPRTPEKPLSGVGRGGLGWARPASGTREPAEKARNLGWLRDRRTAGSVAPSEPRESSRLFGLGCSCAGARGGGGFWAGPRRPPAFRSLGRRKSEASPRFGSNFQAPQNFQSSESAAAWGAAEPLGWGRWIGAPGGAFSQPSSGKRRSGAGRPRKVSPPTAGSGVSRGALKCARQERSLPTSQV